MPPPLSITPRQIQERRDQLHRHPFINMTVIILKMDAPNENVGGVYLVKDPTPVVGAPKANKAVVWQSYSFKDLGTRYGLPAPTVLPVVPED